MQAFVQDLNLLICSPQPWWFLGLHLFSGWHPT
jgi:hypothetical protein